MAYEIQSNIPLPTPRGPVKYPLADMKVGDSFFIPGKNSQQISGSFAINRPKKFSVRQREENGVKGVRVWRIE